MGWNGFEQNLNKLENERENSDTTVIEIYIFGHVKRCIDCDCKIARKRERENWAKRVHWKSAMFIVIIVTMMRMLTRPKRNIHSPCLIRYLYTAQRSKQSSSSIKFLYISLAKQIESKLCAEVSFYFSSLFFLWCGCAVHSILAAYQCL